MYVKQYDVMVDVLQPLRQPLHVISQADVNSNEFVIHFTNGEQPFSVETSEVVAYVRRPDKQVVRVSLGTLKNTATLLITQGLNALSGTHRVEVIVASPDKATVAVEFDYNVRASIQDIYAPQPEEVLPLWQQVSAKVDLAMAEVKEITAAIEARADAMEDEEAVRISNEDIRKTQEQIREVEFANMKSDFVSITAGVVRLDKAEW